MSQKPDYYEVLGIGRMATDDEIKKAYNSIVMKNHPDRVKHNKNLSEEEKAARVEVFKLATEAEKVLRDPEKRAIYDKHGHRGLEDLASGAAPSTGPSFADLMGEPKVRQRTPEEMMSFFDREFAQRHGGSVPAEETPVGENVDAEALRESARQARLARRRGADSASTPYVPPPIAAPPAEKKPVPAPVVHPPSVQKPVTKVEPAADAFRDVAQKTATAAEKLSQAATAEVPLDALERFRDSLDTFIGAVDGAIARAKKGGPRP